MTNSPQIPGNFTAFNTLSFGNSEENYHPLAINNISYCAYLFISASYYVSRAARSLPNNSNISN